MSGIAGAIVGAAALGTVGVMAGASTAAKATNRASNAAIQGQREALAQQERLAAPYTGLGQDRKSVV